MRVNVNVFPGVPSTLAARGRYVHVELPETASGETLIERLGVAPGSAVVLIVNGRRVPFDTVLRNDDSICVMSPLGGGWASACAEGG